MNGIVFWTPYICMHSASVYEELGLMRHVIISCKSLEYGSFGGLNVRNVEIVHIEKNIDAEKLIERTPNYIHINGSLKTYQGTEVFGYALRQLLNKRCFVMSVNMEQYQWWTKKGFLRRLQWFYLFNVGIGRKIKAIGCTGLTGVKAFRKAWISDRRLFVFIYSVPEPNSYLLQEYSQPIDSLINNRMGGVKFIYMGQIAHRKCIIELVRSFRESQGNWMLDIVGGGPQEDEMLQVIHDDHRIHYWGKLMPSQARKVLASADVLLQTSRLEGWGCTVNEALMYGCRVIVSDAVGSKALIENRDYCGRIFRSGDWNALQTCIKEEISKRNVTPEQRKRIAKEFQSIYPKAEADYFLQIVDYYTGKIDRKPIAPWNL